MKLTPSKQFPPITLNADPAKYNALGNEFPRGDARRVIRRSDLVAIDQSPRKWLQGHIERDTCSTEWGELIDCLVITPERFDERFVITPGSYQSECKLTKDEKAELIAELSAADEIFGVAIEEKPWNRNATYCEEWESAHQRRGKRCLKPSELHDAKQAVKRLFEDDEISAFIKTSERQVQVMVDYHDKETGLVIPLKCLIDLVPDKASCFKFALGDLKTTADASFRAMTFKAEDFGYDAQAALYLDAFNAVTGEDRTEFFLCCQESSQPYEPEFWPMSIEAINSGRGVYLEALAEYCQCIVHKRWSGFRRKAPFGMLEPTQRRMREYQSVEAV